MFGAEFCHALSSDEYKILETKVHPFISMASILVLLGRAQSVGKSLSLHQLAEKVTIHQSEQLIIQLEQLVEYAMVGQLSDQSYCLLVKNDTIHFDQLFILSDSQLPKAAEVHKSELPAGLKSQMVSLINNVEQQLNERIIIT
ncbi:MAG: hypothetical protein Q9M92_13880 [Enterobacterales bacterium]|nr:hypothetical protein [Enterobacterales bacterium]